MVTLLALSKAWSWLKRNWYVVAAVVGGLVGIFLLGRKDVDLAKTIDAINKQHQDELDAINKAHQTELDQNALALQKMQSQMAAIQAQYDAAEKQLDAAKKAEIQQILQTSGNDPIALAQKLKDATGFEVVLPPQGS